MFNGFCEETGTFMRELLFNNERPWFLAHKEEYETFLNKPYKALAAETLDQMLVRYPDSQFSVKTTRIYRDARRLFGRGPYKENLWFSIKPAEDEYEGPAFWFEISPFTYSYGMGCYSDAHMMEQYRAAIDANPAAFERIAAKMSRLRGFEISGEEYKKKKGNYTGYTAQWYNRRHIGLMCRNDFGGDLFSPDLPKILADAYSSTMPMFEFLLGVYRNTAK